MNPIRLATALILFLAAAPAAGQEPVPVREDPPPAAGGEYRLGAGDLLDIVVWRNEQLTMRVTVRPDGWISLPLIKDVRAAGRTPLELEGALAEKLALFISDPEVFVIVAEARSFRVSVLGNVRTPGRFQLDGPTSVLDVLALAGGLDEFSSRENVYLLRRVEGTYQRVPVPYSDATAPGGGNIDVVPGDVVIVP